MKRSGSWRDRLARRRVLMLPGLVLSAATVLAVSGSSREVVRSVPMATTTLPDPEQLASRGVTDHLEIPDEFRVPVGDTHAVGRNDVVVGWADRRVVLPSDPKVALEYCSKPAPVVDSRGDVVGFMYRDYGYVGRDAALAPGFSIRAERAKLYGQDEVPSTCWPADDPTPPDRRTMSR